MPYQKPTVQDFRERFPEMVGITDAAVQFALDDASRFVDRKWSEHDYALAIMYLAAHFLTVGETAMGGGGSVVESESFGPISVRYSTGGGVASGQLSTTVYGLRFQMMQRVNVGGPLVV